MFCRGAERNSEKERCNVKINKRKCAERVKSTLFGMIKKRKLKFGIILIYLHEALFMFNAVLRKYFELCLECPHKF